MLERTSIFAPNLFKDKTVLITGGGTGIGFAIATLLGELGARVILAARTEETLEKAASELKAKGVEVSYYPVNIRNEDEVENLFNQIEMEHGLIDVLVNNAGGQFTSPSIDITPNGFRAVVDLNLNGTWLMSHAFGKRLIQNKIPGRILNIVLCLDSGIPGMVHAGAARAGVKNMTKTLAYEWGPYGITVNAIAPGTIRTSGLDQYDSSHLEKIVQSIPLQRMGEPEEVAEAACYLISPASQFITGTTLEIDGGEHLLGAVTQV